MCVCVCGVHVCLDGHARFERVHAGFEAHMCVCGVRVCLDGHARFERVHAGFEAHMCVCGVHVWLTCVAYMCGLHAS